MPPGKDHGNHSRSEVTQGIIARVLERLEDKRGALLPILHGVQAEFGYIPPDSVPIIAETLNLTRAEVHGVVSFYHDFRTEQSGRHTVQICQAESCQAMGSATLTASARERLDVDFDETTRDGAFTLRAVFCLGNCAASPSVMVDTTLHGRVRPEDLHRILTEEVAK